MKSIVIVPTNRPERMRAFVEAWAPVLEFDADTQLYVIEDRVRPELRDFLEDQPGVEYFTHADIDRDLGEHAGCIDKLSPAVRSYLVWRAAQAKPDMIWTTDDDCLPLDGANAEATHWTILTRHTVPIGWLPVRSYDDKGGATLHRGHPYAIDVRQGLAVMLNHGLVAGTPDIDAVTQLHIGEFKAGTTTESAIVSRGYYFPMSIQNVAFRPEVAPLIYLPKLPDGMKRWSDIWCGLVMKKVADVRNWPVTSGAPCVRHERASNVWANLRQEWAGYEVNERLWEVIDGVQLTGHSLMTDYVHIADVIGCVFPELSEMAEGMKTWAKLWEINNLEGGLP